MRQIKKYGVFFLIVLLIGCGRNNAQEKNASDQPALVKVAFWGSTDEIEIITESIRDWEETHPNIKVRFEHTPYNGYVNKILTRIAGNVAPDVICTEVNCFVTFASKHVLHDLSPHIKNDQSFIIEDFYPEVVDRFTVKGSIYAIPRDTAPFACVYYNKDIFDKENIPYPTDEWTWADFLTIAQRLTKRDKNGKVLRYGFYAWAWQNFVYGNGGQIVDDIKNPTKCLLGEPAAVEGLQFFADLINVQQVMPTPITLTDIGMSVDYMFASGKLAMFLSGIWETPGLRNYDFNWDVVMFPKNDEGIRHFGTGGSGYAILEKAKNKEAAWEVVKALTAPPAQIRLAEMGLAQPARKEIAQGEHFAGNPAPPANKGMLNEAVQYVIYDPFHFNWREIESRYIVPALDLIKSGKLTAQEAMKKVVVQVNDALKEKA